MLKTGKGIKNCGIQEKDWFIVPWEGSQRICQRRRLCQKEEIPGFKHKEAQKYTASSGDGKFFGVIIEKDGKPSMLPHQGAWTHHLGVWKKPDQT